MIVFHDDEDLTPKTQKSVMVHHRDAEELRRVRRDIEEMARKFNQDSVLHGSGGSNTIAFTTGSKKGKECGGKGWKETPKAKDFYTDIELKGRRHTKFSLDVSGCFEKGLL